MNPKRYDSTQIAVIGGVEVAVNTSKRKPWKVERLKTEHIAAVPESCEGKQRPIGLVLAACRRHCGSKAGRGLEEAELALGAYPRGLRWAPPRTEVRHG